VDRVLDLRDRAGTIVRMDEQDWLRRIDQHLDDIKRGNDTAKDYMREGHELMARLDDTMERNRVASRTCGPTSGRQRPCSGRS